LQRLETTLFIQDKGTWHHGLFSFNHPPYFRDHKMSVITYVLWRTFGTSIVLLVGSPRNILGEEAVIRDGVLIPGSNGAFFHLLDFIDNSIQTDEPYAVTGNRNIYMESILESTPIPDLMLSHRLRWITFKNNTGIWI